MEVKRTAIIDIESCDFTENLLDYSSLPYKFSDRAKLWCVVVRDKDSGEDWFAEKEDVTAEWLEKTLEPFYFIVAHNGIKFDLPQLLLFGVLEYSIGYLGQSDTLFGREVKFLDSLILSRLANPDRPAHSLKHWGMKAGEFKDDYREQCIAAGYIQASDPKGAEFREWNPLMLPYCRQDCKTNAAAFELISAEFSDHDWGSSIKMEHKLADLAFRRQHMGFAFNKDLALELLEDLNNILSDLSNKVLPLIPLKPLNKTETSFWTPPKRQVLKDGSLGVDMINFLERVGAELEEDGFMFEDGFYPIPHTEILKTHLPAQMKDLDHIKSYLIYLGWEPIEWSERDLTKDSKKKALTIEKRVKVLDKWWEETMNGKYTKHRLEGAIESLKLPAKSCPSDIYETLRERIKDVWPVRVFTGPKIKVGVEKELCPNLEKLGDKVGFAKDFSDWLTYRHRRNSIAGGDTSELDLEEGDTPSSGFLSAYREVDGRIPTPAIEIGTSTSRYIHNSVANVPRPTSIYGKEMRSLFGCGDGFVQLGYDFSSLENRVQGSYIFKYEGGPEMAESLVAEKPNDAHTLNGIMLGISRSDAKSFTYACLSEDTEVLTTNGFIPITDVRIGDIVISYNTTLDILENDVVLNTVNFEDKELIEMKSGSFSIKSTADHRWYGKQRHSPKRDVRFYANKFFTTEEMNSEKSILNSALYVKEKSDIDITPFEAKLLGYIVSDGVISWSKVNPNKVHKDRGIDLRITQSENKFIDDIKETIVLCGLNFKQYGKKEGINPVYDFVIPQAEARAFMDKIFKDRSNKHDTDWSKFILSLSTKSRDMFYEGFFRGDGHKDKGKWDRVTQNYGSIYDALSLCCFLDGHYVSHQRKTDTCGVIAKQQKRYTTGQKMIKTNLGVQPSYCITTNNSTFVIRQGNTTTITGNCLYGAAAPKIGKMLNCDTFKAKGYIDSFWEGNPALNSLKKNLEKFWESKDKKWILGIDGRKVPTRSKHSLLNALFQSGGVIVTKYTLVYAFQKLEELGYCIDPFKGVPDVAEMISYHDEAQLAINPNLLSFEVFDSEEEAEEFEKNWTGDQISGVAHGKNGKFFICLPNDVSRALVGAIEKTKEKFNIPVDLGIEWIVGRNWKDCH